MLFGFSVHARSRSILERSLVIFANRCASLQRWSLSIKRIFLATVCRGTISLDPHFAACYLKVRSRLEGMLDGLVGRRYRQHFSFGQLGDWKRFTEKRRRDKVCPVVDGNSLPLAPAYNPSRRPVELLSVSRTQLYSFSFPISNCSLSVNFVSAAALPLGHHPPWSAISLSNDDPVGKLVFRLNFFIIYCVG